MKPIVLVILDGWGSSWWKRGNAIKLSQTPNIDALEKEWPNTLLKASGVEVGLQKGMVGTSEDGHLTLGSGRVIDQRITRIGKSIFDGSFFLNDALETMMKKHHVVHLVGMISEANIHSHVDHVIALVELGRRHATKVYIHAILDGRDSKNTRGLKIIKYLQRKIGQHGQIATISGRDYGFCQVDDVVEVIEARQDLKVFYKSAPGAVSESYGKKLFDDAVKPCIIGNYEGLHEKDGMIFFNYTNSETKLYSTFANKYDIVTMTEYDGKHPVAFPPPQPENVLSQVLSAAGLKQLHVAESVKGEFVTYFFNGLRRDRSPGEEHIIHESLAVRTFDLSPEMKANEICESVISSMENYDFVVVNFANPDMVGHTGVMQQILKACEVVDSSIGKIRDRVQELGGVMIVTSDHGNCENVVAEHNDEDSCHTANPVPLFMFNVKYKLRRKGTLADVAPTILELMSLEKPAEMTGESLIMKTS